MADQYEDQLPVVSDAKWIRCMDASGNPFKMSKEDLATVLGGLLPVANKERKGLMNESQALNSTLYSISTKGEKTYALTKICAIEGDRVTIMHFYSAPNATSETCRYIRVIVSDRTIFANQLLAKGNSNIRLFKDNNYLYSYIYNGTWSRSFIDVFSAYTDIFRFEDMTDKISISDLTEVIIS